MNHSLTTTDKGYREVTVLVLVLIDTLKTAELRFYPLEKGLEAFTALVLVVHN